MAEQRTAQEGGHIQLFFGLHVLEYLGKLFLFRVRFAHAQLGLEPGGDQGNPDFLFHRRVVGHAEDDVGIRVDGRFNDLGSLVDLEQGEACCRRRR